MELGKAFIYIIFLNAYKAAKDKKNSSFLKDKVYKVLYNKFIKLAILKV